MQDYTRQLHHDGSARYVSNPYPRLGETVTLRVRTAPGSTIRRILLRTLPDGEEHFTELEAQPGSPGTAPRACQWWTGALLVSMPVVSYRFVLDTPHGLWSYNGSGVSAFAPTDSHDFRLVADYGETAPEWVTRSVFYQIFPDRFADGDPGNNVRSGEWNCDGLPVRARRWGETPNREHPTGEFFGGDLPGVAQRLDHLVALGVNAVYLNPIFRAPSVHRYDVSDYEEVDPHLGGNQALARLRQELSRRSMRLMLDIVPNHCGASHHWFQDALRDAGSPTAEFFTFTHHPDEYECWLGVRSLPKLNYRSEELRQRMYAGDAGIFRRWLRPPYSIDSWRVDVANMMGRQGPVQLGPEVARGLRAAVKAENPHCYLLGENFYDATAQLQGDQYDGNMNYRGFTLPLWDWLSEQRLRPSTFGGGVSEVATGLPLSTEALVAAWTAFRAPVSWVIALQQLNLVDSHDTARIRTLVGGNDRLQRLAAALQLTYPGVPCILYGDEIGLEAPDGDLSRRTMPWDDQAQWDQDLLAFYRQLIHLRTSSTALCSGGLQFLDTDADTVAYLRDSEDEQFIVIGYRGAELRPAGPLPVASAAIADGTRLTEVLTSAAAIVAGGCLPLPPMQQGPAIWRVTS